jgi:glutathione S-transferase
MKLFDNPASPFCRKVQVLALEADLMDKIEVVFAVGSPVNSDKMPTDHNPLAKIPTLITDEGDALYDSRTITRFLNDLTGQKFCAADDYLTMRAEALADGIMDAGVAMVYEFRARPEGERSPAYVEAQWGKISRALDVIENSGMDDTFDLGKIALASALGYLDFRHEDREWRKTRPKLAAWFLEVSKRDSMQKTVPHA